MKIRKTKQTRIKIELKSEENQIKVTQKRIEAFHRYIYCIQLFRMKYSDYKSVFNKKGLQRELNKFSFLK